MLGKLSGEDESDGGLDLPGGDGRLLVVRSELGSLGSDSLENVVDEGVEDGHGLVGDTSVGVDLREGGEGKRKEGGEEEESALVPKNANTTAISSTMNRYPSDFREKVEKGVEKK